MALIRVSFSSKLRDSTHGLASTEIKADTFSQLMDALYEMFPDFKSSIHLKDGRLRPFCRVFYNSKDVSDQLFDSILLSESDEIQFVQALSGG